MLKCVFPNKFSKTYLSKTNNWKTLKRENNFKIISLKRILKKKNNSKIFKCVVPNNFPKTYLRQIKLKFEDVKITSLKYIEAK